RFAEPANQGTAVIALGFLYEPDSWPASDAGGAIGTRVLDHDDLDRITVVLGEEGIEATREQHFFIVGRHDNRDLDVSLPSTGRSLPVVRLVAPQRCVSGPHARRRDWPGQRRPFADR